MGGERKRSILQTFPSSAFRQGLDYGIDESGLATRERGDGIDLFFRDFDDHRSSRILRVPARRPARVVRLPRASALAPSPSADRNIPSHHAQEACGAEAASMFARRAPAASEMTSLLGERGSGFLKSDAQHDGWFHADENRARGARGLQIVGGGSRVAHALSRNSALGSLAMICSGAQ